MSEEKHFDFEEALNKARKEMYNRKNELYTFLK